VKHARRSRQRAPTPSAEPPSPLEWRAALAIFALALLVRVVHLWQIQSAPFFAVLMGDSAAYDAWAQQIAGGDWLGEDVFYQAPLYPYVLGALYGIFGRDLLLVRLCQAVIGSLSCVLLALAASKLLSRRAGVIAGIGLALYAPALFFDALVQKAVLDVFFVCLALWLIGGLVVDPPTPRRWWWLGLAIGGLSLTRENALVFVAVLLGWALYPRAGEAGWRPRAAAAGAFVVGLALVLTPVAIRNSLVGGGVFLTTAQFGPNFYIGNNPRADGTYMSLRFGRGAPEYEREDATRLAEDALGRRLTDADVSRYWTGQALGFIRSEPSAWLRLLGRKTALLWNRTEMLDTESQETHEEWSAPLALAARVGHFGLLVPLALLGLLVTWPLRRRLLVLYALALAYAASVVLFYVFARYRYPLVPFLMLFAAAGIAGLSSLRARARPAQVWAAAAVIPVVAVLVNRPMLSPDLMRAITAHNLGAALQSAGQVNQAIAQYRRAVAIRPDYAPAYNNLGVALRAGGELEEAVASYERALALRPDYREAQYNLANALLEDGRPDDAVAYFRRALQSAPASAEVQNNLGIALAATGRFDEAIAAFREAMRLDPASSLARRNLGDAHYNRGSELLEDGRPAAAVEEFRAALPLVPDSADLHNNLGIALASQGSIAEAVDHLEEALRLQPDFADARQNLARVRALQTGR